MLAQLIEKAGIWVLGNDLQSCSAMLSQHDKAISCVYTAHPRAQIQKSEYIACAIGYRLALYPN